MLSDAILLFWLQVLQLVDAQVVREGVVAVTPKLPKENRLLTISEREDGARIAFDIGMVRRMIARDEVRKKMVFTKTLTWSMDQWDSHRDVREDRGCIGAVILPQMEGLPPVVIDGFFAVQEAIDKGYKIMSVYELSAQQLAQVFVDLDDKFFEEWRHER